jgi:putative inorganic carbon (HCO3(-)) transporter
MAEGRENGLKGNMEISKKNTGKKKITGKGKSISNAIAVARTTNLGTYFVFVLVVLAFAFINIKDVPIPSSVTVPIAVVVMLILVASSFLNPDLSLLFLVAYLPFSKVFVGKFGAETVGINLTNILMIVVIISWAISSAVKNEKMFNKAWLNPIVILFCLWGFLALLGAKINYGSAYDFESYFILFKRWVTPIVLYFIVLNMVRDKETLKKVLFVMMLVTVIIALMAIRDYMENIRGSLEESRVGGVFEQPNMLGGFFVYMMFFFLAFFLSYWKKFKYWLMLVPFALCFRGIMVTFSRGAYVAAAFGGLVTTFFKNKLLFIFSIVLLIVILVIPGVLPEGIRLRLASTFGGEKVISTNIEDITDPSAGKRIIIWKGAMEMIKDQPIFGFGYGTFPYVIGAYAPSVESMDAHNTYLILAAEMGIPALALFLIIVLMLIGHTWWLYRKIKDTYIKAFALGVLGGLFGLLAANMFGSRMNTEEVSAYFWIYAGLTIAVMRMKKLKIID